MANSFRYYVKKRGNRRTGSPAWGGVGELLFYASFLLIGCVGTVMLFTHFALPEWRVNHEFIETTCKVLDKRIGETQGDDGPMYYPEIRIEYEVAGEVYRDWHYDIYRMSSSGREKSQEALDRFELYDRAKNNLYPCWYDPTNPYTAVLVREYRWTTWLMFTVPLSFIAIGVGGLIYSWLHWGRSAEHRAALVQRVQQGDLFGGGNGQEPYPSIPKGFDMTNSPGTRLRFRLPLASSPGWALFGILFVCIFWNLATSFFVVFAVKSLLNGRPEWFLTVFIIPFVLVGLALIIVFIRQLLIATGIGPTLLEISDHPLYTSGRYGLFLSQPGRLILHTFRASLVCEEKATYRQGTDTRTETREVYREELYRKENFEIPAGLPFEAEIEFQVPEAAMHSFKAPHNEINWSLVVEGKVAKWPDFKRSFAVVVRPAKGGAER